MKTDKVLDNNDDNDVDDNDRLKDITQTPSDFTITYIFVNNTTRLYSNISTI